LIVTALRLSRVFMHYFVNDQLTYISYNGLQLILGHKQNSIGDSIWNLSHAILFFKKPDEKKEFYGFRLLIFPAFCFYNFFIFIFSTSLQFWGKRNVNTKVLYSKVGMIQKLFRLFFGYFCKSILFTIVHKRKAITRSFYILKGLHVCTWEFGWNILYYAGKYYVYYIII